MAWWAKRYTDLPSFNSRYPAVHQHMAIFLQTAHCIKKHCIFFVQNWEKTTLFKCLAAYLLTFIVLVLTILNRQQKWKLKLNFSFLRYRKETYYHFLLFCRNRQGRRKEREKKGPYLSKHANCVCCCGLHQGGLCWVSIASRVITTDSKKHLWS